MKEKMEETFPKAISKQVKRYAFLSAAHEKKGIAPATWTNQGLNISWNGPSGLRI